MWEAPADCWCRCGVCFVGKQFVPMHSSIQTIDAGICADASDVNYCSSVEWHSVVLVRCRLKTKQKGVKIWNLSGMSAFVLLVRIPQNGIYKRRWNHKANHIHSLSRSSIDLLNGIKWVETKIWWWNRNEFNIRRTHIWMVLVLPLSNFCLVCVRRVRCALHPHTHYKHQLILSVNIATVCVKRCVRFCHFRLNIITVPRPTRVNVICNWNRRQNKDNQPHNLIYDRQRNVHMDCCARNSTTKVIVRWHAVWGQLHTHHIHSRVSLGCVLQEYSGTVTQVNALQWLPGCSITAGTAGAALYNTEISQIDQFRLQNKQTN